MSDGKGDFSRRKFLSTAATGLVSAGVVSLTPRAVMAQQSEQPTVASGGKIICRTLGRTGLRVPIVSMGVMNAANPEIVQASYEIGIRHFDTAAAYQFGRNEQMVGSVVNRLGIRDQVYISTKIFAPEQRVGISTGETKEKLLSACDASLRRLRTDHIDILYIHSVQDPAEVTDEAIIDGLNELKKQGKIRFAGVATHTRMGEIIDAVADGGYYDVVLTAINFTMADDAALLMAIEKAAKSGVGIIAMKAMAGGSRWPNPGARKDYTSSTIATACLKWVLNNENIATSIPGYINYEHMNEDFSVAYDLKYTEQEKKFLSDQTVKLGMAFCRQCQTCLPSCPKGVAVPTLMRTHMYAAQYGDLMLAREALNEIPRSASLSQCVDCRTCVAQCAHTVDIAHRVNELRTLYA